MDDFIKKRAEYLCGHSDKDKQAWKEVLKVVQEFNDHAKKPSPNLDEYGLIHLFFNTQISGIRIKGKSEKLKSYEPDKEYFAKALEIFRATFEVQCSSTPGSLPQIAVPDTPYDALISMVGFSPQPIAYTILTLKPKNVYLVTTEQSAKFNTICIGDYFQFVIDKFSSASPIEERTAETYPDHAEDPKVFKPNEIARSISIRERVIASSEDTTDVFRKTRELIRRIRAQNQEAKIAIDISGGKKSMDASAFLSGAIEKDIDIFYVDFEEFQNGRPLFGSEFLNRLDNPYAVYNIEEEELVQRFWKRRDYAQALIISEDILKDDLTATNVRRYGLQTELARMTEISRAAACYSRWSAFNYEAALQHKDFAYYRQKHVEVLGLLSQCSRQRRTPNGAIYLSWDRWMRGKDIMEKDGVDKDLDKAALYFEQVLEILSIFRLCDLVRRHKNGDNIFDMDLPESFDNLSDDEIEISYFSIGSLLRFLFGDSALGKIPKPKGPDNKKKYCKKPLKWASTPSQFGLSDTSGNLTCQKLLDGKEIRNQLAHFECFGNQQCTQHFNKVSELMKLAHDYITLFHHTYKAEVTEFSDIIKAKLTFASIDDLVSAQAS